MGMSVWSQCDTRKYFSISTIEKKRMDEYGLNMTIQELRNRAVASPPYAEVLTGQSKVLGYRRKTKIYRYEDFVEKEEKIWN